MVAWQRSVCIMENRLFHYVCTHTHTHKHKHTRTRARTYIHTYIHTYIQTYIHTYIHTYKQTYRGVHGGVAEIGVHHSRSFIPSCMYVHTRTHKNTNTKHTLTYIHTYVHTEAYMEAWQRSVCITVDHLFRYVCWIWTDGSELRHRQWPLRPLQ